MTDPTLATVDDEPWNRCSPVRERRIAVHAARAHEHRSMTPAQRARAGLPIFDADGQRARFLYDVHGITTKAKKCQCGAQCTLSVWVEFEYEPKANDANAGEYRISRELELCNTCSNTLKALPLGQRWNR